METWPLQTQLTNSPFLRQYQSPYTVYVHAELVSIAFEVYHVAGFVTCMGRYIGPVSLLIEMFMGDLFCTVDVASDHLTCAKSDLHKCYLN